MLLIIATFLAGAVFVISVELFILYRWFQAQPNAEPRIIPIHRPVSNPQEIINYCGIDGATDSESCMFLNLIFQFLWKEWRDSPKTRNFFIRKMNLEFQEMLLNKAAGKVMEQITVKDYYLGDSLPVFKNATIMKIDTKNPSQVPREVDIALDVEYSGGFIISLDVDLIFGKKASMTIELSSLIARVRLQYTRNPCTHWSFSFYEDPIMDLNVDSNFEGKKLPKLTSFISNQIRKSIKKKHTLPRYKVRYKPFFIQQKPQDGKNEVFIHNSLVTVGKLDLEVVECTRIPQLSKGTHIYCSLSLDPLPWKEDMPMRRSLWPVHEVLMCRAQSGSIGVSFYRSFENDREIIMIKTISPNSPASQVDILRGDLLISVNNVDITTMKQAVRLIKNAGEKFTFKLQRPPPIELQQAPFLEMNDAPITSESTVLKDKKPSNRDSEAATATFENDYVDYNSILIKEEEDSETEEFVNIVVNEITKEISNDEATRNFINEVKLLRPSLSREDDPNDIDTNNCALDRDHLHISSDMLPLPDREEASLEENVPRRGSLSIFNRTKKLKSNLKRSKTDLDVAGKSKFKNWLESSFTSMNGDTPEKSPVPKHELNSKKKEVRIYEPGEENTNFIPVPQHISAACDDNDNVPFSNGLSNDIYEPLGVTSKGTEEENYEWDNISNHNVEVVSETPLIEEEKEPTGQNTTLLNANKDLVWNETFAFDVEKEHRFLNVCVWSKHEDSFQKDVLLGYISIPLMELAVECLSTSSHKTMRNFSLATTSSRSAISRAYLRTMMPGMNLNACNGDIQIAYQYTIAVPEVNLEEEQLKIILERLKKSQENQTPEEHVTEKEKDIFKEHIFVGQEFYFPTRCDYCQNKVWRKVAFQCRVCAMISHKRCIQNAQANTYCTSKGVRARPPKWQKQAEEATTNINTTEDKTNINAEDKQLEIPLITIEENYMISPSIEVHENDLRPGIKNNSGHVSHNNVLRRRKPHQRHARKVSLQEFISEDQAIENIPEDVEDGLNDSIATAAVVAKEAGRELFASLDKDGRQDGIQEKVRQLQNEIRFENDEQNELRSTLEYKENETDKQKIRLSLRKSEERSQALALLMIQYCAALNECISIGEPQQCDL